MRRPPAHLRAALRRGTLAGAYPLLPLLLVRATPAGADAGAPMLLILGPEFLLLLGPVILLEARVFCARLGVNRWHALRLSSFANALSTLVGVPLTWVVLLQVQLGTAGGGWIDVETLWDGIAVSVLQAPWIVRTDLGWVLVVAVTVLFAAFFLVTLVIETASLRAGLGTRRAERRPDAQGIARAVLVANLQSYALMYAVLFAFMLAS